MAIGGRAFDLLLALIELRDRVAGKDELLARVWPGTVVEENNLTVQVSALRKLLGTGAIATVAGRGYRFTLPLRDDEDDAPQPAAPERPVIAVLAFDNLSNEPEMQFFSDGVSEEIIQRLARGTQLRVISRTTSFQFRGERKADAAATLHCTHVLDGAIRRAAGQVRISAHLMEAASGTTLWSERYERALEGVFAVQDDIAESIARALELDAQNNDALVARCFVMPPFGRFVEAESYLEALRRAPGAGDGRRYISWLLRLTGRVRASLEEAERVYRLDRLDPMSANLVALARIAAGRVADAVPVYEDLVARVPQMSFAISSLLRAQAFLQDWGAVDRLLALAATRPLREFQDTLPFVRAQRDPTPAHISAWRSEFEAQVTITGGVDVARLVYAAHLGLVDEAYRAAEHARLGPAGASTDIMGPDGYRTALLFQAGMPELRNDPRFPRLCVRLGLVAFWLASGLWPDCADEVPYDFRGECARVAAVGADGFGF